ncbi:MAG: acetyl-CoA carboxylase biotin carboxyl carrier protein [Candidatus Aminicenantes bacterium]|nr:acetyl-CoA carboxylase biotin carboxyl carrier protein [Candidatus Aminicenantes bacterium]
MKAAKREELSITEREMRPKIDFEEIARLLNLIEEKNLSHFELETEGFRIKISKEIPIKAAPQLPSMPSAASSVGMPLPYQVTEEKPQPEPKENLHYITSPMVGTFYRAPDPTSPPFVEIGDVVKKNQTLCIIEAMKLMNEIESDIDGIVREIYVENGKPVEYGQRLFALEPIS